MHKNNLFSSCIFQVGTSPSPLTVNRGRGQRRGRVLSWQEIYLFVDSPLLMSSPFSMLQQIQIAAPCPVSSETGFFLQPTGGDEVLDGALDGCLGQTCVAGNGWDGRETGTVLVAPARGGRDRPSRRGTEVCLGKMYRGIPCHTSCSGGRCWCGCGRGCKRMLLPRFGGLGDSTKSSAPTGIAPSGISESELGFFGFG